mmetsp:Transcript_75441/g.233353  ORF Transcript_75441/g.233353 Transcript_75441/m.233353 type:complete len:215 (-) Transcript_75441:209-853(-)
MFLFLKCGRNLSQFSFFSSGSFSSSRRIISSLMWYMGWMFLKQSSIIRRTCFRPFTVPMRLTVWPWTKTWHWVSSSMAFNVEPLGPTRRWRRFTKRSFERTMPPILMMSQWTSSSSIFWAWGSGTLRARSLIMSRALMMMYGSQVFRVVRTVMEPSTRFRSALSSCSDRTCFTSGQTCLRYCSRYAGKSVAKELSSVRRPPLGASSFAMATGFQ